MGRGVCVGTNMKAFLYRVRELGGGGGAVGEGYARITT